MLVCEKCGSVCGAVWSKKGKKVCIICYIKDSVK